MALQQLDSRLTPEIDFTRHDEITFSLLDAITCPIRLEITDEMIIFNHQYYDQVFSIDMRGPKLLIITAMERIV